MARRNSAYSTPETINIASYDRSILVLYYMLVLIGWLMIYTVNYLPNKSLSLLDLSAQPGKQFMFIVICTVMLTFIAFTNSGMWKIFSMAIYTIAMVALVGVLFFGSEVNGANAWYHIGGFSFQPAELAKFGVALAFANVLSSSGASLRDRRTQLSLAGLVALPIFLILLQPDAGSALVFTALLVPLYREGLSGQWYILGFGTAILVVLGLIFPPPYVIGGILLLYGLSLAFTPKPMIPLTVLGIGLGIMSFWWKPIFAWLCMLAEKPNTDAWIEQYTLLAIFAVYFLLLYFLRFFEADRPHKNRLQLNFILIALGSILVFLADFVCFTVLAPHQQERIKVWLRPQECDPRGSLYNILHSKMAISSGGFSGKGFLEGAMTKLKYVPEQDTDFIFCTVSEEQGFIGVVATLALFSLLVYRILVVAERSRSNFTRIYGYTIAGIILVHFIVNIGMTMGLFPIIGIPLPFISYGGSSLIGFTLLIGVFLKLARGN